MYFKVLKQRRGKENSGEHVLGADLAHGATNSGTPTLVYRQKVEYYDPSNITSTINSTGTTCIYNCLLGLYQRLQLNVNLSYSTLKY